MRRPVRRPQLVADQAVGGLGVGDAQQRLGETHEDDALAAGQAEFLEKGVEPALPIALGPHRDYQAPGQRLDARARFGCLRFARGIERREQPADNLGLGRDQGLVQACAQGRGRRRFVGEDHGGAGAASPRARPVSAARPR